MVCKGTPLTGTEEQVEVPSRLHDLPVLFTSGFPKDDDGEVASATVLGAYLQKPFTARGLAQQV